MQLDYPVLVEKQSEGEVKAWSVFRASAIRSSSQSLLLVTSLTFPLSLPGPLQLLRCRDGCRHWEDHRHALVQPHHLLPEQWQEASRHHGGQHPAGHVVQVGESWRPPHSSWTGLASAGKQLLFKWITFFKIKFDISWTQFSNLLT